MKPLILSTYDIEGGAARAANRLHQGLQTIGVDSQMLVQTKYSDDRSVAGASSGSGVGKVVAGSRLTLNPMPLKLLYPNRDRSIYSLQWLPENIASKVARLQPDVVNLHFINHGYLQIETLSKLNLPLIWTLQDMWAFTGGCHYSGDCEHYAVSCGACPQLGSKRDWDLSRWVWQRKAKAWQNLNLTVVAVSSWLAKCASSSNLFKNLQIEIIPNGLDIRKYRPIKRQIARELLCLPQDKQVVLFGALEATSNKRKGFHLLQPALQELSQSKWQNKLELVVFGSSRPENPSEFGFKVHYVGHLADDLSLALIYSAADVMIVPSIQEAFGQTGSESLACGTPVVAFNETGLQDIVDHKQNGYLAEPYEIEDLAQGIAWVLENEERYQKLSYQAREKAEQKFSLEIVANRYLSLYKDILKKSSSF